VGVVALGKSLEESAHDILALHFLHILEKLVVAAGDCFLRGAELEFTEFLLQKLGFHAVAPDLIGLGEVFRPG